MNLYSSRSLLNVNYTKMSYTCTLVVRGCLLRKKRDAQLFVDHKGKDTHLGGTSVVKLNSTLLNLLFFGECVPAVVKSTFGVHVTEVTDEFVGSGNIFHDGSLQQTDEENKLGNSGGGDGLEGGETVGDVGEFGSVKGDVSAKTVSGFLDKVSNNGKHGDTSVLDFNISETVELLLVSVGDKAKGIPEAKRRLSTKLVLESLEGRGGSLLGG